MIMSNIFDYLKSLLPKFGKDKVAELVRQTQNELTSYVIPSYLEAEKGIGVLQFKSPKINSLTSILKRTIKPDRQNDNIVRIIRTRLESISLNNRVIENHIDDSMEDEIVVGGITVLKVNLLRFIEASSFVSRYASKFLNYIYIYETAAVGGDITYIKDSLSKGEIQWIEDRFLDFVLALSILSKDSKNFNNIISSLPEVTIDNDSSATGAVFGDNKLDPFGFRHLSGFTFNPIMHVSLIAAAFQANRYKEQKELKTVLQLRLLNLQNVYNSAPDAKLEKEIEYVQRRIDRLSDDIRKAEED